MLIDDCWLAPRQTGIGSTVHHAVSSSECVSPRIAAQHGAARGRLSISDEHTSWLARSHKQDKASLSEGTDDHNQRLGHAGGMNECKGDVITAAANAANTTSGAVASGHPPIVWRGQVRPKHVPHPQSLHRSC
jgi:hypothetical protein